MAGQRAIDALIESFHSRSPVRAWSLIVSVFGVVALPESRALRLNDLQDWLGACRVEAGLVRTSLSRLVSNGTLHRERDRKAALYKLSASAEAEFRQAAELIYGRSTPIPTGWLQLAILEGGHSRTDLRKALTDQGFAHLTASVVIRPEHLGSRPDDQDGVLNLRVEVSDAMVDRASAIWPLAELSRGYGEICDLADMVLADVVNMGTRERLLCRILLVHAFRRLVLRDPFLPPALLTTNWRGNEARTLFDSALHALGADDVLGSAV